MRARFVAEVVHFWLSQEDGDYSDQNFKAALETIVRLFRALTFEIEDRGTDLLFKGCLSKGSKRRRDLDIHIIVCGWFNQYPPHFSVNLLEQNSNGDLSISWNGDQGFGWKFTSYINPSSPRSLKNLKNQVERYLGNRRKRLGKRRASELIKLLLKTAFTSR